MSQDEDFEPKQLSEAAMAIVGGPDLNADGDLPKALTADEATFPWLTEK